MLAVFFYVRYSVSNRDVEEVMEERGIQIDYTTLRRWIVKYAALIADEALRIKKTTNRSWCMANL
ncbi:IS6 family transposase [Roseibium aggregatum]|uniref:IS6 family transposase n=1 Tax=Roseibium aggregatum TaxID=187304 RepID=A0A939EFA9_9HYPH|nr:IS6 family transposase [Roseibium aggregatum]